jgi:hypothetical protein
VCINIEVEIDLEEEASQAGAPKEDYLFWRRLLLAAAKEKHLAEVFGEFVEPEDVTDDIRAINSGHEYDKVSIWPEDTCDDFDEWGSLIDLLRGTVFFDSDWLLNDMIPDLPPDKAEGIERNMSIPEGYFGSVHPDPSPSEARDIFESMYLFLMRYLGYPATPKDQVPYFAENRDGSP